MYDLIIKGGTVFPGANEEGKQLDVAISGDKIKKVGKLGSRKARRMVDATGKYVTPGFIDIQNHSDGYWTLFWVPGQESMLRQGVTTIVGGSDGSSVAPLSSPQAIQTIRRWVDIRGITVNWATMAELFATLERLKLGVNFASMTGHMTLRRGLVGDEMRKLDPKEVRVMEQMYAISVRDGSFGFSTALAYSHSRFTTAAELKPFLELTYKGGGVYATHLRDEGLKLREAVDEALVATRESKVSLLISHLKAKGKKAWPIFDEVLGLIETAHGEGVNVNFNVYPYAVTGSVLYAYLPAWATEGGRKQMIVRLKDKTTRVKIIAEMEADHHDYSQMVIAICPFNNQLVGKNVFEMGRARGLSSEAVVIETLIAGNGHVIVFDRTLSEENVQKAVTHPLSIIATSSAGYNLEWEKRGQLVHPRSFGTFPRFLREYVREKKLLAWKDAIYKITGMPATKLGLTDRGFIAKGKQADVVVFDPEEITDLSTYKNPYRYSKGISTVIVNGEPAVLNGKDVGVRAGRVIRK